MEATKTNKSFNESIGKNSSSKELGLFITIPNSLIKNRTLKDKELEIYCLLFSQAKRMSNFTYISIIDMLEELGYKIVYGNRGSITIYKNALINLMVEGYVEFVDTDKKMIVENYRKLLKQRETLEESNSSKNNIYEINAEYNRLFGYIKPSKPLNLKITSLEDIDSEGILDEFRNKGKIDDKLSKLNGKISKPNGLTLKETQTGFTKLYLREFNAIINYAKQRKEEQERVLGVSKKANSYNTSFGNSVPQLSGLLNVYCAIKQHIYNDNKKRQCNLSLTEIIRDVNVSKKTLIWYIEELQKGKMLVKKRQYENAGEAVEYKRNLYKLI